MKRSRSQANITVSAGPPSKRKRSTKKAARFPRNGVSETARAKLKYACEVTLTTTGISTVTRQQFAANGLYDTDITGIGVQPLGFDEWMTLYNLYTVVGGKVKATPVNSSVSAVIPSYFCIGISDGQILNGATSQNMLSSSNNASNKAQPFSAVGISKGFQSTGEVGMSRSVKWQAKDIMGVKSSEEVVNRASLQGNSTSNPSDLIYATLIVADCAAGGTATSPYFLVEMEFDCIFSNPKQLAMS